MKFIMKPPFPHSHGKGFRYIHDSWRLMVHVYGKREIHVSTHVHAVCWNDKPAFLSFSSFARVCGPFTSWQQTYGHRPTSKSLWTHLINPHQLYHFRTWMFQKGNIHNPNWSKLQLQRLRYIVDNAHSFYIRYVAARSFCKSSKLRRESVTNRLRLCNSASLSWKVLRLPSTMLIVASKPTTLPVCRDISMWF